MSKRYKEKIQMRFNISQIEKVILSLLNNPTNKKFAGNVSKLFNSFLPESYTNDYEKEYRCFLAKKLASIILENNIEDKDDLLNFISFDGKYSNDCDALLNNIFNEELSESDTALIDKQVSQQLRFGIIGNNAESLADLITNYQTDNYDDLDNFMKTFSDSVDSLEKDLRLANESIEERKNDVNLSDNSFIESLRGIINNDRNPGSKIKTGIQALNEIFSGGLERGRVYLALGLAKGWKSGFLLNTCLWAIKYNDLKPKDPTKKPVVVYLTQENSISETIKRIWAHCFGNDSEISQYEPVQAARMLESAGIFNVNNPEKAELLIWHRANKSINTADMQVMIEDLAKEGKECVLLVQDYIKRIRATTPNKELRIELSNISDEFATIAKTLDIPILTAMQLNREAFRAFEEADSITGQVSAVEKLGASNVGESIDLIQNVDYAFIIGRGTNANTTPDGEIESVDKYLIFKLIACRSKQPKYNGFQHRFKENNDMALIEDINMPMSISVKRIEGLVQQKILDNGQKTRGKRSIV